MKFTYRLLISVVSIAAILPLSIINGLPALAQGVNNAAIPQASLYIYPEYDDPRLLVMLDGLIPADATLPITLQFMIPSTASLNSAGSRDTSGNYVPWNNTGGDPPRTASALPGWDLISFPVSNNNFVVEYYDPIIIGKTDKTISYEFDTLNPISKLAVYVQEPLKSSNFTATPEGQVVTEADGYTYHEYSFSDLPAGTGSPAITFDVGYTKSDSRPSQTIKNTGLPVVPIIAGSLGGIILITGIVLAVVLLPKRGKSRPAKKIVTEHAAAKKQAIKSKPAAIPQQRFCQQCGEPLGKGIRFCPNCGTEQ